MTPNKMISDVEVDVLAVGWYGLKVSRTIISLEDTDKLWLDEEAKRTGKPMTEVVRIAIRLLRAERERSFKELLAETSGTWTEGDGLEYQQRIRSEWD